MKYFLLVIALFLCCVPPGAFSGGPTEPPVPTNRIPCRFQAEDDYCFLTYGGNFNPQEMSESECRQTCFTMEDADDETKNCRAYQYRVSSRGCFILVAKNRFELQNRYRKWQQCPEDKLTLKMCDGGASLGRRPTTREPPRNATDGKYNFGSNSGMG